MNPTEVTVKTALENLGSGAQRSRERGVAEIRIIFGQNGRSSSDSLKDNAYHHIFEALFKVASSEKQNYLTGKTISARTKAENNLSDCSDALRLTIRSGSHKLKAKTVRAVIEHVTQLLPSPSGGYCAGLTKSYFKVLEVVLQRDVHIEQLEVEDWRNTVDFCLNGIRMYGDQTASQTCFSERSTWQSSSSKTSPRTMSGEKSHGSLSGQNLEEMMQCLLSLVSASNSPIVQNAEYILLTLTAFLESQVSINTVHRIAFQALNHVLSTICGDRLSLSQSIALRIVPVISRLWSLRAIAKDTMLNSVRDQMLITLLSLDMHLERLILDGDAVELLDSLELLESILFSEYSKRADRDKLQLQDLDLHLYGRSISIRNTMQIGIFRLTINSAEQERKWAALQVLSTLEHLLASGRSKVEDLRARGDSESSQPRKRRRITKRLNRLTARIQGLDAGERLTALQSSLLIIPNCNSLSDDLRDLLELLVLCMSDTRSDIGSWASLTIALIAQQAPPSQALQYNDWTQLWHTIARLLTGVVTCRTAAYTLHAIMASKLVEYRDITDDVDAILSDTSTIGPAVICDSSLSLMSHLLHVRNLEIPKSGTDASRQIIRWFASKWQSVLISDVAMSIHTPPLSMLNLLRTCSNLGSLHLSEIGETPAEVIGQSWKSHQLRADMLKYLLLLDKSNQPTLACSSCPPVASLHGEEAPLNDTALQSSSKRFIAELFIPEFRSFVDKYESQYLDQTTQLPREPLRFAISMLVFGCLLNATIVSSTTEKQNDLDDILHRLSQAVVSTLTRIHAKDLSRAAGDIIHPYLPRLNKLELACCLDRNRPFLRILTKFSSCLNPQIDGDAGDHTMDIDGLDDIFGTSQNTSNGDGLHAISSRTILADGSSHDAYHAMVHCRAFYLTCILEYTEQPSAVPSLFINHLIDLDNRQLLLRSNLVQEILDGDLEMSTEDAVRLVERIGKLIGSPEHERDEIALSLCLNLLNTFASQWTIPEGGSMADLLLDMYDFIIMDVIHKHRPSQTTQTGMADLFFKLMRLQNGYELPDLPSARTSLLDLLKTSEIQVRFHIGARLPMLFEMFVLKLHSELLLDIVNSLPSSFEWFEGVLFRLFVLGRLACSWPTVLRNCVYYILEVPGHLPTVSAHASRSLTEVSQSLKLKGPTELFRLFASQLLYTWLEEEIVENMPYVIFGYTSLLSLLDDCQHEIAGILTMRNQDEQLSGVARALGVSHAEILEKSFTKVMAYSVAHDISVPPRSSAGKYVTGEARVRKTIGKDRFYELLTYHFADIVALLFQVADQEENVARALAKKPDYSYAAQIMEEIQSKGGSSVVLPPYQQPAFRAKFLPDELEFLCKRTQFEVRDIYTPTMIVFVARSLLNTVHPALGPLHACSVLRKLRILIALSNKSCLRGYCLKMLVQGIRPYMTNSECADDAMGLMRYLLQHGGSSLYGSVSFVAGLSLSIFTSLRAFVESTPDSTTLDSQYQSTLTKAQAFHHWFGTFLESYQCKATDKYAEAAFRNITRTAYAVGHKGNVNSNTAEGTLLIHILEDERSGRRLLNKACRDLTFSMLYSTFEAPSSFRQDILGSDDRANRYAVHVWQLCREANIRGRFLVWVARVLGRSFAASGQVPRQFVRESDLQQTKALARSLEPHETSRSSLLLLLHNLTQENNSAVAGLAESVIRVVIARIVESLPDAEYQLYESFIPHELQEASQWTPHLAPPADLEPPTRQSPSDAFSDEAILQANWLQDLEQNLSESMNGDILLHALPRLLTHDPAFGRDAFPFILHLALLSEISGPRVICSGLSKAVSAWLRIHDRNAMDNQRLIINALLYLRTQAKPGETSSADRMQWLSLDYADVARAAVMCNMFKTALLFLEISMSEAARSSGRRTSMDASHLHPTDLFLIIFRNIDDPDMFYGLQQVPSLDSVLRRLEYERDSMKSLTFRSALYDTSLRLQKETLRSDAEALVGALGSLSLNGLSHSLLQSPQVNSTATASSASTFLNACKLEQWDLPVPSTNQDNLATVYQTFQSLNTATNRESIGQSLDHGFMRIMDRIMSVSADVDLVRVSMQSLAVMTEIEDVLDSKGSEQFEELLSRYQAREGWMKIGRFEDVNQITSMRGILLSSVNRQPRIRELMNINTVDARIVEVKANLLSSELYRTHMALQESLTTASYLTSLIVSSQSLGLTLDAAIHLETANALWEQGEMSASIGMLRRIDNDAILKHQTIPVARSILLAKLGFQISVAKLEKSGMVVEKYLEPALKELKGQVSGSEAGHVFHQFAVFCDEQLQDPDNQEDLDRLRKLKEMKESEIQDLAKMIKSAKNPEQRNKMARASNSARQWFLLDNDEYMRHLNNRHKLLRQSLENYLLSLAASDDHNNDSLRLSVLWLEHSEEEVANEMVAKHIDKVPSRKFASLMNQLTSRLQKNDSLFQKCLYSTVLRICTDHPYHGMYQIWAGRHTKVDSNDLAAAARQAATMNLSQQLSTSKSSAIWSAINATNRVYCQLAGEKNDRYRAGTKFAVKNSQAGMSLHNSLNKNVMPPPTMHIDIAADLDYSRVPVMTRLEPMMSIASGVSAPKIITVMASNGVRFRQLVKGGNDDLRQDAIMEQVFAQVSELLKTNTSTRQRALGVRTYKVLPLSPIAGIIEFVPNSIPLHDYLMPAHERYYPKDLKPSSCRKLIGEAQTSKLDHKLKVYRGVADKFHPVMRYFFMEKFHDPEDWFLKRSSYTKSSAVTSILGHVLGLGDRHGHNILLDEHTGEVIHIDLGVAFEMGRILPVPELIPFRLTRDTVDGMGVTKTEGVFRRCCEFTLEALRKESSSIVAILDVLRYDPLHSWSISPVRLAKLQDAQSVIQMSEGYGSGRTRASVNEPGEADRALTVVKKKLSKTLSVTATVNDLINQATDERHLAALYSGWAAYA